ncbi:hypothetical protein SJA_C1-21480 [Sphingobium indicum UT26S]|uniref:Uncharacterized protein n=1 Tax=Sphingobium indicum (strain DSM 16413 / CCM 7287 / MTCC 6362 / UT26 / NBRC 101211 / UT26S) TaxID=452662 RepID=D4Z300_SPHIU|nr:hypothetical protein SJA_C1-21480 [Sphingobium indicum UT26S]
MGMIRIGVESGHSLIRHPGLDPGSRCLGRGAHSDKKAGPRIKSGVTETSAISQFQSLIRPSASGLKRPLRTSRNNPTTMTSPKASYCPTGGHFACPIRTGQLTRLRL